MKPRAELHQSAPSAMARATSNALMILPLQPILIAIAQIQPHERVVHEQQPLLQRRADVIGELERRGARAAFGAVDDDEVGQEPRLEHRLADREPLPRMADAELEARRLAARELAQPFDELQQPDRRAELAVPRRAQAVFAGTHAARRSDLGRDLRARQHTAVAGFRALAQLDLDHLDVAGRSRSRRSAPR